MKSDVRSRWLTRYAALHAISRLLSPDAAQGTVATNKVAENHAVKVRFRRFPFEWDSFVYLFGRCAGFGSAEIHQARRWDRGRSRRAATGPRQHDLRRCSSERESDLGTRRRLVAAPGTVRIPPHLQYGARY